MGKPALGLALRVLAIRCGLFLPCVATAQTLVRSDLSDLPDGDGAAGTQPIVNVNGTPTERLIRQYTEAAGPVGPRKIFADAKFITTVSVGEYYDDNIVSSTTGPGRSDYVTTLTGGLTLVLGDVVQRENTYALLNYTGTGSIFARHGEEDSYDQDALVNIRYRRPMTVVELTGHFQDLHDATADLGQREGRRLYDEGLVYKEFLTDRTSLTGRVEYLHNDYDSGIDTSDVKGGLAVEYAVTDKLTAGAEAVLGRLTASDDVGEWYEQARLRASYTVTDKAALEGWIGLEVRERGGQSGTSATPVFSAIGKWTPFTGTTLSLNAYRQINASGGDVGEDFIDTGLQAGVRQEIAKRFFLSLDVGYDHNDYRQVSGDDSGSRSDDYFLVRASGGYAFVDWFKLLVYYEHRQNDSTRDEFSFDSNRYGTTATVLF